MEPSQLVGGTEECNSSESGWTMYIASPMHDVALDGDGGEDSDGDSRDDGDGNSDNEDDDSDDSMASDASSGQNRCERSCKKDEICSGNGSSEHNEENEGDIEFSGMCSGYPSKEDCREEEEMRDDQGRLLGEQENKNRACSTAEAKKTNLKGKGK